MRTNLGGDGLLVAWNLKTGYVADTTKASRRPDPGEEREVPTCVAVSHDNMLVAVGTDEGAVLVWELKAPRGRGPKKLRPRHESFRPHKDAVRGTVFRLGSHELVSVSDDQTCAVLDADAASMDSQLTLGLRPNCFDAVGGCALVGGWDARVLLCDVDQGSVEELATLAARVQDVALSADGRLGMATTSADVGVPQLLVWELSSRQLLRSYCDLSEWVSRGIPCVISADGRVALSATWDRS